ncbi:MAG: hypothetical protein K6E51_14690 [Treponema sp.]|nr:hypothetical protein [Treponema sp.]
MTDQNQVKYSISEEQAKKIEAKIADGALFALTHRSCRLKLLESTYIQTIYLDDAVTSAYYAGLAKGLSYRNRSKKRGKKDGKITER